MLLLRKGVRRCSSSFWLERRCSGDPNSCLIYASVRPELLHAAHWRASRHRLDAELVDAEAARAIPAREMIEKVLTFARPTLEEDGDLDEVAVLVRERWGMATARAGSDEPTSGQDVCRTSSIR